MKKMTNKWNINPGQAQVLLEIEEMNGETIGVKLVVPNSEGEIIGLYITNMLLTKLPESISNLTLLQQLDLGGNDFTMLPESIGDLPSLQELTIVKNPLTSLPESIGNLKSLLELELWENNLITLPKTIGNLISLQRLDLGGNQLIKLPKSIGNLSSLQLLILGGNNLTILPESIGNLNSLQSLDLNCNQITSLPESIGNLSSLQMLDLSGNRLNTLPGTIGSLLSLQKLYLDENKWEGEWAKIVKKDISSILEFCKLKSNEIEDKKHDVFICHSSKDKQIADAVCHFLEKKGIKCWIAPRDVSTGSYAESIVKAIQNSKLMVLIFTNNANLSKHVKRELELAVKNDINIQPFRTEVVEPTAELEYYISSLHWLDALTPPLEAHLRKLVDLVSRLLVAISNDNNKS